MIVRTVQVNQPVSDFFQHSQCAQRTINELPVGSGSCKYSSHEKPAFFTGFDSLLLQDPIDPDRIVELKQGLDRTLVGTGADERLVGPLPQDQLQSAKDDRLSGTCLSCDDVEPGFELPIHRFYQSKITDS